MKESPLEKISKEEIKLLKEFLSSLKEEKDAIISFSLEGLIREKNRKEEIMEKLSLLEKERKRIMEEERNGDFPLKDEIRRLGKEVMMGIERNRRLLSFSINHIESSIQHLLSLLKEEGYGKKKENISLLLSKEV